MKWPALLQAQPLLVQPFHSQPWLPSLETLSFHLYLQVPPQSCSSSQVTNPFFP